MNQRTRGTFYRCLAATLLFVLGALPTLLNMGVARAQDPTDQSVEAIDANQKPTLTAEQIVSRLQEKNHEREVTLRKFQGTRIYRVHYDGFFGTREAEAVVSCDYASPNRKEFVVLSQTGTKFIHNHVIKGLLEVKKRQRLKKIGSGRRSAPGTTISRWPRQKRRWNPRSMC